MKGGIEPTVGWLALLADAQFWEVGEGYEGNHVYPHQVHERGWIPLPRNVFLRGPVQPDDLSGRIVPELCYGAEMALYIPGEAGALSALKAIPRRLDELCAQHGLPTLQG